MRIVTSTRAVALFEAAKGIVVLLVGFGVLSLIHRDIQRAAEQLVSHLHLNPAKHYPRIFLDAAAHLTDARIWFLAILAATYALARFIESYGLWRSKRWAEWFAAVSGGIYLPFEVYELAKGINSLALSLLVINVLIVAIMINALRRGHQAPV